MIVPASISRHQSLWKVETWKEQAWYEMTVVNIVLNRSMGNGCSELSLIHNVLVTSNSPSGPIGRQLCICGILVEHAFA